MNSNFYLYYGDDISLINNEVSKLKNKIGISGDIIYYDIENISDIVVESSTIGMFNPYKFIVIDTSSYFSSKKDMDISSLTNYFDNYNVNSYLIFTYGSSSIDSRRKLFKLISDKGVVKKLEANSEYLNDFISTYIKDNGYSMDMNSMSYLLSRCDNNIDNIRNELDKLMLYKLYDKVITREDISLLTIDDINDTVFELVSSILKNNNEKAMKLYYNFINNGMDVSQIIAVISNQIRLLFQVKRLYNSGKSNDEIAKILEFKSVYRVKYLLNDCYYYSESDLLKYLSKLAYIDKSIKTGNGDGRLLLELFIAKKDM